MTQEPKQETVSLLERALETVEMDSVRYHIRNALQIAAVRRGELSHRHEIRPQADDPNPVLRCEATGRSAVVEARRGESVFCPFCSERVEYGSQ